MNDPPVPMHPGASKTAADAYSRTLLGQIDHRWLRSPLAHWIAAGVLLVALVVPGVQSVRKISKTDKSLFRESGQRQRTALGRWLPTAALLNQPAPTDNPYEQGHWFPTPPLVLIGLAPLARLSPAVAGGVWAAIRIVGFLLVAAYLVRSMSLAGVRVPLGVLIAAGVFSLRPVISDLQHANLNIFVFVWLGLAWALYLRGHDLVAGLLIALAIVTKVTPGLTLVYFLYKREWRVCLAALVGLILFVVIVPGLALGFERNFVYLRAWFDMLAKPYVVHGWATIEIANQSLYGVLMRILSNADWLKLDYMPVKEAMAAGMDDMARPAVWPGKLLRPAITAVFVGLLAWVCRIRRGETRRHSIGQAARNDLRLWLEFSLVLLAMLLMGERTWKHHATTLPIVFLAMWMTLVMRPWPDRFRAVFVASLAVQIFLLVLGGEGVFGDRLADQMMEGGIFCWGLLLAFLQTAVLLIGMRRAESPAGPAS